MLFFENVCPKVPYISDFYHYTNSVFVCFLSFIVQLYMFTCSFIHDYRSSYLFVVCVCVISSKLLMIKYVLLFLLVLLLLFILLLLCRDINPEENKYRKTI